MGSNSDERLREEPDSDERLREEPDSDERSPEDAVSGACRVVVTQSV
jgi:hypothetical protein